MKAVVVLLLLLVAAVARAEDNLQYEQAAYQDNAAESDAVAEQQTAQQDAAQEEMDVESQAVADADSAEAEVEMVEDSDQAEAQAEAESEIETEQTEGEEGEAEAEEQTEAEAEESFVEVPNLTRHPVKSLSSLAHKAGKRIQNLKAWVAKRQKGGAGGAGGKKLLKKKFPRRLPKKPTSRRPKPPVQGKRPAAVTPVKSKPKKKVAAPIKNAIKKLMAKLKKKPAKPVHKKLPKVKKPKEIKHKKPARRPLRPWAPRRKPLVRVRKAPKRKPKIFRRPPPPPTAGDRLWHSERWVSKEHDPNQDPEMAKLNLALDAVKQDILATNKQINDERRWSIAVHKIVTSYKGKLARVDAHIIALRKEMKALYRKKKQIENLKLQRALETKLKEARAELSLLTTSLKHVAVKQGQLNRSGADLRATIAGIQGQLAKLRGQSLFKKKKCGKGKKYSRKHRKCIKRKKGKGKKARKAARKLKRMLKRKL